MALYTYRITNEAISKYLLVKPSPVAGRVEVLKIGDSAIKAIGVALTTGNHAGVRIKVQEVEGVQTPMLSDGTTAIAIGDAVEPSEVLDGHIRKGSASPVGVAMSAADAVEGAQVEVL